MSSMSMGFGQHMEMRPSPSLIAFTEILQYSGMELQEAIRQAAEQNPALELAEVELCPACGDPLLPDGTCLRCARGEDLVGAAEGQVAEAEDDEFDPFARVADQMGIAEHLVAEVAAVLDDRDLPIAEYLIGELDDRGFLETPVDQVAAALDVDPQRVETALAALQAVGPLGLAARSVQECLLLQLDRWADLGVEHPLARRIVEEHMDDLGHGRYATIARALGVDQEEVLDAREFIRSHLRPYPITEGIDLAPWEREVGPGPIAPDVMLRLHDGKVEVDVVESRRYALSINPLYRRYTAQVDPGVAPGSLTKQDRRHIESQVQDARQFINHVRERRETMRRVASYVAARQDGYLRDGPRSLVPLTRAEVAEALDLHESTVSRATAGKYVLLPNRQVVPFATFFKAALSVHDALRELIAGEGRPLTDDELAALLAERGHQVARRTVAKYRNEMGILPSSLR
jgi:RNA polymerase sigma-54 factor